MEKSILTLVIIFFGWTITSFICHFFAKLFLAESSIITTQVKGNILYLTGMQIAIILLSMYRENSSKSTRTTTFIILSMHVCATLATNWSIAMSHAASTFAIKLMEPLTGAFAQRLVLGVRLSCFQCLSIPLVIIGALIFADDSNHTSYISISAGSVLAFTSNIFLAFRNVNIKRNHLSNTNLLSSDVKWIADVFGISCAGTVFLFFLTKTDISLKRFWYLYLLVSTSAIFHTIYSYISTVLVLKQFSVVGHAFGNIMKRLLVIGLLYIVGSRSATVWNGFGIIICTVGLILYAWSKVDSSNDTDKDNKMELYCLEMSRSKTTIILAPTIIAMLLVISHIQWNKSGSYNISSSERLILRDITDKIAGSTDEELKLPNVGQLSLSQSLNFSLEEFYATDLTEYPEQANKLSPLLTKRSDVIAEAQRIHMKIFSRLLNGYKYAMLFDYSPSENKGDAAIVVGEATLLRRLNIDVIFACSTGKCGKHLDYAEKLSKNYTSNELVILLHGGGNIIGYHKEDKRRFEEIPHFKTFNVVMFPQSIFHRGDQEHIAQCKKVYSHPRFTFIWRDTVSFNLGKRLFPKVRSLLSPDIVFQLGPVKRFMDPTQDILWIKRTDAEKPGYEEQNSAGTYRMHVADWIRWSTPKGTSPMENSYLMTANGMMFLSRGRIVVTDRLHGFILSVLLNIPHVFIDNKQHKLSNYHNSWTHSLENLILATSSVDALVQAKYLLTKLDDELPKISGYYKNTGY